MLPEMPTVYGLPWDTKMPMFPASARRAAATVSPRPRTGLGTPRLTQRGPRRELPPLLLPSGFGSQVSSLHIQSTGPLFSGGPQRFGVSKAALVTPSPLSYKFERACGPQPLSSRHSEMQVSMSLTEERWQHRDRVLRLTATPGPAAYFPRQ
jgi:hypothetical protein